MSPLSILGPILLVGSPLFGLVLGALLPAFMYGKNTALAIVLNAAGFLIYILPALFFCFIICADNFKGPNTRADYIETVCLALGVFAAVEGVAMLLRRYRKANT